MSEITKKSIKNLSSKKMLGYLLYLIGGSILLGLANSYNIKIAVTQTFLNILLFVICIALIKMEDESISILECHISTKIFIIVNILSFLVTLATFIPMLSNFIMLKFA